MTYRKKLIEVALPLDDINRAAAEEKSVPRRRHPQTIHLWWARRPLAAARAVLFGQLVDDPSAWPELWKTEAEQSQERERLFDVIRSLVPWDASNDEPIIYAARFEIARSHARAKGSPIGRALLALTTEGSTLRPDQITKETRALIDEYLGKELPPVRDPFAGGGTIPLEAQRLGLRAIACDLNPVAVLINKALIEMPPKFANRSPVNPDSSQKSGLRIWKRAEGLAEDVRYYGEWIQREALSRISHLYPPIDLTREQGGGTAKVIAWLWARTVASPNPAFAGIHVPLVSTFWLLKKGGKEVWVEPVVQGLKWQFEVRTGNCADPDAVGLGTKIGRGANFRCLLSGAPIEPNYIKAEGRAKRIGTRLMAIMAEGKRGRLCVAPLEDHERVAASAKPVSVPEQDLPDDPRNFWTVNYGLTKFADLFTPRQLVAMTTFSDLILEVRQRVLTDAKRAWPAGDNASSTKIADGPTAYADAVSTYLALGLGKLADYNSSIATWNTIGGSVRSTFGRQAVPMTWDFFETNPLLKTTGSWSSCMSWVADVLDALHSGQAAEVLQADAAAWLAVAEKPILSTDPPYYDNIGYADLSDFFYVWFRRSLGTVFPDLFATILVPKTAELIASPYRHGGRGEAEKFFLSGMTKALGNLARTTDPLYPVTIYYAFRQSESDEEGGISSTGWETFLEAVLASGFSLDGTWPVRTERGGRANDIGANALASSVVLVCRARPADAPTTSRADFRRLLRIELPAALKSLQHSHIAPVDLAQASVGPGMAIFSRHTKVLEPDGSAMTVRTSLQLINEALDEFLTAAEGELDADTRFGVTWFETNGFESGPYGMAETLAKARNVSVHGVEQAGLVKQAAGKVRLLKRSEMSDDWDPAMDERLTVWAATQNLIKRMESGGEQGAAALIRALGTTADQARDLAYRLYSVCERKGWAEEARAYNSLVVAWPELQKLASSSAVSSGPVVPAQASLALGDEAHLRSPRGRRKAIAGDPETAGAAHPPAPLQTSLGLKDEPFGRQGTPQKTKAVPKRGAKESDVE